MGERRRRREKETFRISKPRNRPTEKKYNTAREIICVWKKRPHLSKKKKVKEKVKERNNILEIHFVFVKSEGKKEKRKRRRRRKNDLIERKLTYLL
jgi:hypothetical protein